MSAFEDWFKSYYIKHGFISSKAEAEEAFNAGMEKAAEICANLDENEYNIDNHLGKLECQNAIIAARDGK